MEKIDLNNYEAYFLDFMEGTLSAEEKHDLWAFLELHPELKAEMQADFGAVELMPDRVIFEEKENLKIGTGSLIITANTVDDLMVAAVEGQLSKKHEANLMEYIKQNNLTVTFAYYKATVLKPDMRISYPEKEKLKVKTGVVISFKFISRVAAVAAVGAVLITLAFKNWNAPETFTTDNPVFSSDAKTQILFERFKKHFSTENDNEVEVNEIPDEFKKQYKHQPNKTVNGIADQVNSDAMVSNRLLPENKDTSGVEPKNKIEPNKLDGINPDDELTKDKNLPHGNDPLNKLPKEEEEVIYASAVSGIKREEPYKIVTDLAEDIVNRDIAFTRDRNLASNSYVAYGFKVGKFEFERKRSK